MTTSVPLPTGTGGWHVAEADSLDALPQLPDGSIDAVVTDPPYGISFHQQDWDGRAIHHAAAAAGERGRRLTAGQAFERWTTLWATEAHRLLKPGGHLLAFGAPRMSHRLTSGLEEAGLEIRDVLMWLYATGIPKSRRLAGGMGTSLKPAYEPIILARRPPAAPIAENVHRHATGALNIDPCRITSRADQPQTTVATPDAGRWPANVVLTHAPGCQPRRCHARCPARAIDEQAAHDRPHGQRTSPSRLFYCPKANRRERDAGCQQLPARELNLFPNARRAPRARSRVRNAHPTVKPLQLMRWLVRLATPDGGLVLDPFCGSGTTGIAAVLEQRRFVGIERDGAHAAIARARITHWSHAAEADSEPGPFAPPT